MKICWNMLENIYLTTNGTFRKNRVSYVYKESCIRCGESYLTPKHKQSSFCSFPCGNIGKKWTEEQKQKLSIAKTGKRHTEATKRLLSELTSGENNPMFGVSGKRLPIIKVE